MMSSPPAGYRVRVDGHLGDQWTASLGDWAVQHHADGTTAITAAHADQAQLHGLLTVLRDLNVTLLSVAPLAAPHLPGGATRPAAAPGSSSRPHRWACG